MSYRIPRGALVYWWYAFVSGFIAVVPRQCESFVVNSATKPLRAMAQFPVHELLGVTSLHLFFADESQVEGSTINIVPSKGDESSIREAAAFMVDAFWLNSPQQLIQTEGGENLVVVAISDATRATLIEEQAEDLTKKYGERMGKRLLDASLLTGVSTDSNDIFGIVGIEVCLFDKNTEQIIPPEKAEPMVQNAVSSLGPKQRRQYKDSSVDELVLELLPPHIQTVCCLSNLAVSPNARRQGIAGKLCEEAERIASVEWGYDNMFLKVESENTAARFLYEEKLGYNKKYTNMAASALRVDPQTGSFVETQADTLILVKDLD